VSPKTQKETGDKSFQAITCTGTDNSKQTGENTPKNTKRNHRMNKLTLAKQNMQNTQNTLKLNLNQQSPVRCIYRLA